MPPCPSPVHDGAAKAMLSAWLTEVLAPVGYQRCGQVESALRSSNLESPTEKSLVGSAQATAPRRRLPWAAVLVAATCTAAALVFGLVPVTVGHRQSSAGEAASAASTGASLELVGLDQVDVRRGLIKSAAHPSMCADVPHGSAHRGNRLQLWRCSADNPNMQFEVPASGTGPIRFATHPHMCLDVLGGSKRNGSPVALWHCGEHNYHANQLFIIPAGGSGPIQWKTHPEKCLDIAGGSAHNGNSIRLWDCLRRGSHPNQLFTLPGGGSGTTPSLPSPIGTSSTTAQPVAGERPFCAVSSNVWKNKDHGDCAEDMAYLRSLNPNVASTILCREYGGRNDPCSIDINNDKDYGLDKSPAECGRSPNRRVFFLWDEPTTHRFSPVHHCSRHGTGGLPSCIQWAAMTWKRYADKWARELSLAREAGMKVASPRFTGGNLAACFEQFFAACPECSTKGSRYYIDVLAFNAWVWNHAHNNADMAGNVQWIEGHAKHLKATYGGRPVYLADFGSLGATSAAMQADVIANSGVFASERSNLDGVYYFAAQDFGGGTTHNGLKEVVASGHFAGKTLGEVLLQQCRR